MNRYIPRPAYPLAQGHLNEGYTSLADALRQAGGVWLLEGASGLDWQQVTAALQAALAGSPVVFFDAGTALLPLAERARLLSPDLGNDDPNYARLYSGALEDLFSAGELYQLAQRIDQAAHSHALVICAGPGSSLVPVAGHQAWLEISKEKTQKAPWFGRIPTLAGNLFPTLKTLMHLDWPLLDQQRARLLPELDLYVDATDPACPVFTVAADLRASLGTLSHQPFRTRTILYPSAWGGHWILDHIQHSEDLPNVGWAFALVAHENGILFQEGTLEIEVPFDLILQQETLSIQGERAAAHFGTNFPVRFNLTDTMGGSDLSMQVHPTAAYARQQFGTPFTENETYYVFDHQPGSKIYLGLQENLDP
ncbi:MAG: hypothetical protein GYA17_06330, partial [Chloroflexi bacterium]|nr:hypothetical protein [Chloroflexota bacterium]